MIYAKTVCRHPGSFVTIVPVGLRVSLQYNASGVIQSAKVVDVDDELVTLEHLNGMRPFIPQKIGLTGGTTWVEGVFYFADIPTDPGVVPECCYETYLKRFIAPDCMCQFYAGNVTSLAAQFHGVQSIRNWLGMNGFQMLPGTVVPTDLNESTIEMLMQTGAYSFKYPYIAGFYVYELDSTDYVPTDLHIGNVSEMSTTLTPEGYVQSNILLDEVDDSGEKVSLILNYSDVCLHSIQEGASLFYYTGERTTVLATRSVDPKQRLRVVENQLTCPVCKKIYYAPAHGPVQCDDPHCLSRAYPDVCRMLRVFELPELSIDDFSKLIVDKKIITFTDVLTLEPYNKTPIKADLVQVLKAAVPPGVCADGGFFEELVRRSNNAPETLQYYINNPIKVQTELDMVSLPAQRFSEWCKDNYNIMTIATLIQSVDLVKSNYKFEGAPIFRGNTIAITGQFKRGATEKIQALLEGYAAKVVTDFEDVAPNMLVTGGTASGISGKLIQAARKMNVPVIDEDQFFETYDIVANVMNSHLL